jgi:hypothetical protein
MPNYWGEVIKSNLSTMLLDRRMKRKNNMPAEVAPRKTYVAHYYDESPPLDQNSKSILPDQI